VPKPSSGWEKFQDFKRLKTIVVIVMKTCSFIEREINKKNFLIIFGLLSLEERKVAILEERFNNLKKKSLVLVCNKRFLAHLISID